LGVEEPTNTAVWPTVTRTVSLQPQHYGDLTFGITLVKKISKKLKLGLNNTTIDKMLTYASETWTLTKRDRKELNIFERKVYRLILCPVYDNEK